MPSFIFLKNRYYTEYTPDLFSFLGLNGNSNENFGPTEGKSNFFCTRDISKNSRIDCLGLLMFLQIRVVEKGKKAMTKIRSDSVWLFSRTENSLLRGGRCQWVVISTVAGDPPQSLHLPAEPSPEAGGELWTDREGASVRWLPDVRSACCVFHELCWVLLTNSD